MGKINGKAQGQFVFIIILKIHYVTIVIRRSLFVPFGQAGLLLKCREHLFSVQLKNLAEVWEEFINIFLIDKVLLRVRPTNNMFRSLRV